LGGFNVFAYVGDTNAWVDLLGLAEEFEIGTYGALMEKNMLEMG